MPKQKRKIKPRDVAENGLQILFAGLGYLFFGNITINSSKQMIGELSNQIPAGKQEIENTKKALIGDAINITTSLFAEKRVTRIKTKRNHNVRKIVRSRK